MALLTLPIVDLFYLIMFEDPHQIAFGWGHGHIWLHTILEDPWPHYMILEVCWDGLWTLSFGLSQFHGHGSWLVCEVAFNDTLSNWCLPLNPPKEQEITITPRLLCNYKIQVGSSILFVQFIPNTPSILVHWRDLIAHPAILAIYVMTRTPFQYTKKSTINLEWGWPVIDQILNSRPCPL
jgi:hypothetical protein